jgi:predicted nucleic acid-binding protein
VVTGWVVDTSMALAWGFPDESSPAADRFWREVESGIELYVPGLWWFECANALLVARRRERLNESQAQRLSALLGTLPVNTAAALTGDDLVRLQVVAWKHGLSAYDAAYLDLARTLTSGLATLNTRLAAAAVEEDLPVWE